MFAMLRRETEPGGWEEGWRGVVMRESAKHACDA